MSKPLKNSFLKVRVECPQCAGGYVGHMTADELRERSVQETCDLSCPACGLIHLSREEVDLANQQKIVETERYRQLRMQAEAGYANTPETVTAFLK
jgi:Zn-finger nucleic acid-binding protein